jgi:hypothetical protein
VVQVPVQVEGRIDYFLSMGVNASSLQSLMTEQRFPAGWVASIVDRKGPGRGALARRRARCAAAR